MKNILFYGDYDCTTGFGNVSKELVNEFSKEKVISQGTRILIPLCCDLRKKSSIKLLSLASYSF